MFGGGGMGGPLGGGPPGAAQPGHPFGGIPSELQAGVDLLLAEEPDRGESEITFSQQPSADEKRQLSLGGLIRVYPGMLAAAIALVGVIGVASQLGPWLTENAINRGMAPGHHHFGIVIFLAAVYLAAVAISAAAQWGQVRVTGRLASWVMNDLRTTIFRHLQRLSLDFFTEEKAGVVMSRMTSDIEFLQQLLQDGLAQFAIQGLTMVVVTTVLFSYNWRLALITVAIVMPATAAASLWFRAASARAYQHVRDGIANVIADVAESLSGVRIVAS